MHCDGSGIGVYASTQRPSICSLKLPLATRLEVGFPLHPPRGRRVLKTKPNTIDLRRGYRYLKLRTRYTLARHRPATCLIRITARVLHNVVLRSMKIVAATRLLCTRYTWYTVLHVPGILCSLPDYRCLRNRAYVLRCPSRPPGNPPMLSRNTDNERRWFGVALSWPPWDVSGLGSMFFEAHQ